MADENDPPRRYYDLKPRDFERVNAPPPAAAAGGTPPPGPAKPADPQAPIDIRDLHRHAGVPGPVLKPRGSPEPPANEVQAILKENLDRANAAGLNDLPYRPRRKSRRKRDFWLLFTLGNLGLATLAMYGLRTGNAVLFVSAVAGVGIVSASLIWVMWFIMDDY